MIGNNYTFHCLCYFKTPTMAWVPLAGWCRCKIFVRPTSSWYKRTVLGHAGGEDKTRKQRREFGWFAVNTL